MKIIYNYKWFSDYAICDAEKHKLNICINWIYFISRYLNDIRDYKYDKTTSSLFKPTKDK